MVDTTDPIEHPATRSDYEAIRQRHVADIMAKAPENIARITWSQSQIRAEREVRLRHLVGAAKIRSPWHARRLAKVDPETFTEEDLTELPPMTKDDAMANWDEIVADPRLSIDVANRHIESLTSDAYLLDRYHVVASGGTSGTRGVFPWDWDAWTWLFMGGSRNTIVRVLQAAERLGRPPVMAMVEAAHPAHMSNAAGETFSTPMLSVERLPVTLPLDEIVEGLNRVQPTFLMAYGSVLGELAQAAADGKLNIAPTWVSSTSEVLRPATRAQAEAQWGVIVSNGYASSEGGFMGSGCAQSTGIHLTEDLLIVEPVDDNGRPVPVGQRSTRIYITNLINPVFPLIRYEIGDRITFLDAPCPCGSAYRRIADIEGRTDEAFVYGGGVRVHPLVFDTVIDRVPHVLDFRVKQTSSGATVEVKVTGPVDTDQIAADVAAGLHRAGLTDAGVAVRVVDSLGRSATGKLKRFVPLPPGA